MTSSVRARAWVVSSSVSVDPLLARALMSLSRAIGRDVAAAAAAAADVLVVADAAAADVLADAADVLVVAADVLVVAADVLRLPLVYTRCCEVTQLSDTIIH